MHRTRLSFYYLAAYLLGAGIALIVAPSFIAVCHPFDQALTHARSCPVSQRKGWGVPMSFKDFPEDVWSSLRTPSNVPVMTVLEPSNAALAALNILALRNPLLYMLLREKVETMALNMAMI